MSYDSKRIVAKLGRLCRYLEKIEFHPEDHGCAATIRKARMLTQQIKEDLSANSRYSVTADKAVTIAKCLADLLFC